MPDHLLEPYRFRFGQLPRSAPYPPPLALPPPTPFLFLIRALAPLSIQQAAPLVPIYSFGVYSLFFLVPVTLRSAQVPRKKIGDQ